MKTGLKIIVFLVVSVLVIFGPRYTYQVGYRAGEASMLAVLDKALARIKVLEQRPAVVPVPAPKPKKIIRPIRPKNICPANVVCKR